MTHRTFIIPGALHNLSAIKNSLHDGVCGILLDVYVPMSAARSAAVAITAFADRIYTLESLVATGNEELKPGDRLLYEKCLSAILSDSRVHYLAARTYINSAFNNSIRIEQIVLNSVGIISSTRPTRLIASSTPHSVESWIFAKCCEYIHLPVYVLDRSPIMNRSWIYRGLDTQEVVLRRAAEGASALTAYSRNLLREQREAMPGARDKNGHLLSRVDMGSVRGAQGNRWWSYRRELRFLAAGRLRSLPLRLLAFFLKKRLYASHRCVEARELPTEPYVIYFMHYQPERTSLPEGLQFAQQWMAIRLLSMALPKGWTLLVREHPSTWFLPLDVTVRTVDLYGQIAKLGNTRICSMDLDTFHLIDGCRAASTLTGSVGFQALLRDKPVIAFGLPPYKDHPACFSAQSLPQLIQAFEVIQRGDLDAEFNQAALEKYLLWVENNSIVADENENDLTAGRLKNFTQLYRELLGGVSECGVPAGPRVASLQGSGR
jgi:hypothetical protein